MKNLLAMILVLTVSSALLASESVTFKCVGDTCGPETAQTKTVQTKPETSNCPSATEPEKTAEEISKELRTDEWDAGDLLYGPQEILYGTLACPYVATVAFVGSIASTIYGDTSPLLAVYAAPASFISGAVNGALISPVMILEGLFDTVTLGAYYPEHSEWLKQYTVDVDKRVNTYLELDGYPPEAKVAE